MYTKQGRMQPLKCMARIIVDLGNATGANSRYLHKYLLGKSLLEKEAKYMPSSPYQLRNAAGH